MVGNSLGGWVALELALAGSAGRVTAIAPAGLWSAPLVPKSSLAHRLARVLEPLIEPAVRGPAAVGGCCCRARSRIPTGFRGATRRI